jgi:mycofactocin glycosyltransferase
VNPAPRRFVVDGSWQRPQRGNVVIAGSPLRLFRLTDTGRRIVEAVESAGGPLPDGHEALTGRLLDAGAIHPVVDCAAHSFTPTDVTVVIPSHQSDRRRLASLVHACDDTAGVIVVDDGSPRPVDPIDGADVVRRPHNGGPGAARQDGWTLATTPLVAFVDDDTSLTEGWLQDLLAHFDDPSVGLVAPRVRSTPDAGSLATYERGRSPLDLGPAPGRIRAGTRISYVPAAVLVVRRAALESVGGFDPTLRYGEDVDLVWRLDEHGWRCRYEPAVVVGHAPRAGLRDWLRQRSQYGSSAAPLALRHPGALAPVRMNGWSLAVWALAAAGHPLTGLGVAGGTTVALARRLGDMPDATGQAVRLAGMGHLYAGRQLASAITRSWWPLAVAAALVSRRARWVLLASATVPALIDWVTTRPPRHPVRHLALRLLDDAAYGAGLWRGVITHRTLGPLLPRLSPFPSHRSPSPRVS